MMPHTYVLDTSVLYTYLKGKAGFGGGAGNARQQEAIWQLLRLRQVVIPHIALVELIGQFFHTNIDLSNYPQWHRVRMAAFNPILATLFSHSLHVRIRMTAPRRDALAVGYELLPASVVTELLTRFPAGARLRPREPKYLDGVDLQILDDAVRVAMERPAEATFLISGDLLFGTAVTHMKTAGAPAGLQFLPLYALPAHLARS